MKRSTRTWLIIIGLIIASYFIFNTPVKPQGASTDLYPLMREQNRQLDRIADILERIERKMK